MISFQNLEDSGWVMDVWVSICYVKQLFKQNRKCDMGIKHALGIIYFFCSFSSWYVVPYHL